MSSITQNKSIASHVHADKTIWVWSLFLLGAFFFCFATTIASLIAAWRYSYIYSYGFLVPLISLYIIWVERRNLKSIQPSPNYLTGFPVLLAGMLLLIIGTLQGGTSIRGLSLVVTIIGIILLLMGKRAMLLLWFPITYLLFMVPFWDNFTERLHTPFQNFSAMIGAGLLRLTGIPVYREAVYIVLPNITLEVAKVCSGVNQLIAVVAIALVLSYLTLKSWRRGLLLICSGIVITVLANGLRIALIGILSHYGISKVLHGPYHVLQAMSISILSFVALFIGAWILSRGNNRISPSVQTVQPSTLHNSSISCYYSELRYPFLLAIGVLLFVGTYIHFWR